MRRIRMLISGLKGLNKWVLKTKYTSLGHNLRTSYRTKQSRPYFGQHLSLTWTYKSYLGGLLSTPPKMCCLVPIHLVYLLVIETSLQLQTLSKGQVFQPLGGRWRIVFFLTIMNQIFTGLSTNLCLLSVCFCLVCRCFLHSFLCSLLYLIAVKAGSKPVPLKLV